MKHKILKSFSVCLFILAITISVKTANAAAPLTIKVDGNLNDAAWKKGREISAFHTQKGEIPKAATTGKILTDANYLYLAFQCEEPLMNKLQQVTQSRDGAVYNNDCIEIFVAPFADTHSFYHLIVDAKGQIYDAFRKSDSEDTRYSLDIIAATQKQSNSWSLEVAIPLCELGLSQVREPLMNFCRERKPVGELTSWHGWFAAPDSWQRVKLTLSNQHTVDMRDWDFGDGSPLYGDNTAKSTFGTATAAPLKVLLYTQQQDKWILKNSKIIQTGKAKNLDVSLDYALLPNDQPTDVRLVFENNNESIFRVTYQLDLPEKALVARLQTPYYYSTEDYGFVQLQNVISAASIKHASIWLIVKSPDGKLQQTKKIYPLSPSMTAGFNISSWQNGEGSVFVELFNNGKPLAHQRLVVTKCPGPFSKGHL